MAHPVEDALHERMQRGLKDKFRMSPRCAKFGLALSLLHALLDATCESGPILLLKGPNPHDRLIQRKVEVGHSLTPELAGETQVALAPGVDESGPPAGN